MNRRTVAALGAALSLAGGLVLTGVTPAVAGPTAGNWCSDSPTPPCVSFASLNGSEIDSANTTYDVTITGTDDMIWYVSKSGGADLNTSDNWIVTIDTGTVVPRVAHQYADNVTVKRIDDGDGTWHIRITGNPVVFLNNDDCDTSVWPWTCPTTATSESTIMQGSVTDYNVWDDVDQRKAMNGMNYSTNIEVTSIPPEITYDSTADSYYLLIRMANSHYHPLANGHGVFAGFAHLRIPNQFLRVAYGVDDPTTMTSSGLTTTGAGTAASVSVSQEPDTDAMLVDITGMTFSTHLVKIKRGVITPTRPTHLQAGRIRPHRGKIAFDRARARGSHITGYRATCYSSTGHDKVTASNTRSPIVVTGLHRHVGYDCRVRAKSKAGLGTRSAKVHIPRNPPPGLPSTG